MLITLSHWYFWFWLYGFHKFYPFYILLLLDMVVLINDLTEKICLRCIYLILTSVIINIIDYIRSGIIWELKNAHWCIFNEKPSLQKININCTDNVCKYLYACLVFTRSQSPIKNTLISWYSKSKKDRRSVKTWITE